MESKHEQHKDLLASLNKAQRRAVTSESNTVAILAGPGSGKTHTLTSRVVWLIQNAGYRPSDVIVATFTVKAAREMKERIGKILGQDVQKKIILGTFHSIARRYLVYYGKNIGLDPKFGIADDTDSKAILDRIIKRRDLTLEPAAAKAWISKKKSKGSMEAEAPVVLSSKGKPVKENPSLQQCYQEYQEQLQRSNLLDFDDLLVRAVELLQRYPICVCNVQAVLVDEYQDTNGIQYDLMKLFSQYQNRITIVGDPDQSIYGWRSAEIRNLHRMLNDFPSTEEISLEENYRSSQSIVNASLDVIQQDSDRYQKVLLPIHSKGTKPVLRRLTTASEEGQWIVSEIQRVTRMSGSMLKGQDCVILLRAAFLSRHVESALGKKGIPYRMLGGHKFYERKEIKILVDYLRAIHQPNNNDVIARIINVPKRGVGEVTIKVILEEAEVAKKSLWELLVDQCNHTHFVPKITTSMENKIRSGFVRVIESLGKQSREVKPGQRQPLVEIIQRLITELNYAEFLEKEFDKDSENRWATVQEFVNMAADFVADFAESEEDELPELEVAEQHGEDSMLGRFLANIALASNAQGDKDGVDTSAVVTISTIHAAKGLEWPVVFVPCVYDGSIPNSRSEDLKEERRLLYVAMTRAKVLLYLSCPLRTSFGYNVAELSPFIADLGDKAFAEHGPSFDRNVVENIAKILGRSAPLEETIYSTLPSDMPTEDDRYPDDPCNPTWRNDFDSTFYSDSIGGGNSSRKRQRLGAEDEGGDLDVLPQWGAKYLTTMQKASSFSMANLPGFTTASAHKVAGAATATGAGRAAGKGKRGQHTLVVGHAQSHSNSRHSSGRDGAAGKAAIDPSFTKHRMSSGKSWRHWSGREGSKSETGEARRPYGHFSSPPRQPQEQKRRNVPPLPSQLEFSRPVSSMHETTFEKGRKATGGGGGGGGGGVRRRAAASSFGRQSTTDRVRKPFKPLTVNGRLKPR